MWEQVQPDLLGRQGGLGGFEVQRRRLVAMCQAMSMCLETWSCRSEVYSQTWLPWCKTRFVKSYRGLQAHGTQWFLYR
jgi:hypothetical protein